MPNTLKTPSNVNELTSDLLETYSGVGAGTVKLGIAKIKSNIACRVITAYALQLQYAAMCGVQDPEIPFLMLETRRAEK